MFKDISCGLDKSEFSAAITSIFSVTCCIKAFFFFFLNHTYSKLLNDGVSWFPQSISQQTDFNNTDKKWFLSTKSAY